MAYTCYLWVTLLSPQTVDVLVTGLVRKGWHVGPLASSKELTCDCPLSVLVSLRVEGVEVSKDEKPQQIVLKAAKEVLKNYIYLSIISHCSDGESTWNGGNIKAPETPTIHKTAFDRITSDDSPDEP